jgi:hypothetical protein
MAIRGVFGKMVEGETRLGLLRSRASSGNKGILNMKILLTEKEKKVFDILLSEIDTLDALNIVSQFAMLKDAIDIDLEKEETEEEEEEEEDNDEEAGKIPQKPRIRTETMVQKTAPGYDRVAVIENKMYV